MSFISGISLENFKGISNRVNISLKPLTLLFGANSAGKSTILHALLYIREVIRTGNADIDRLMQSGVSIDLGGFKNLVHKHDTNRVMRIRFELDYSRADLTSRVTVDEILYVIDYNQKQSTIDLSTIGDIVETGWIEFHIGIQDKIDTVPKILFWEVGFDGIWFARIGNWVTREMVGSSLGEATAFFNEIHPLLALPEDNEKTGNIYGGICEYTRTGYYQMYFSKVFFTLPEEFDNKTLFAILVPEHGEETASELINNSIKVVRPRNAFIHDSLRATVTPDNQAIVEIGILTSNNELAIYRTIDSSDSSSSFVNSYIESVVECPEILNMHGCIPDWEKPFKTGRPFSDMPSKAYPGDKNDLDQDPVPYIHFIEQMIERLCIGPLLLLKDELSSLRYIGPIRDIIPRDFEGHHNVNDDRWVNGYAAWDALYRDIEKNYDPDEITLVEKTSDYLNEKLGLNYTLHLEKSFILPMDHPIVSELDLLASRYEERDAQYVQSRIISQFYTLDKMSKIKIVDERNGVTVEPDDIGVGVSQVLPVVVGALEKSASILAVEQPELHVHPAVACNLGDLFIREFIGKNRLCLIETHSEHLVLRLLRRIRETTNKPDNFDESLSLTVDDISVITVENNDGVVTMVNIPIREDGEFSKKWPSGFFEEREEELF